MDSDPDATNMTMQILVLVALTLTNAFFAGAEMALVSVNKSKLAILEENGNKKARLILNLLTEPTKFLSTIQVAITLSGFFASASAATGISQELANALKFLNIPYTSQISFVLVTVILSFFTLVYGELVPKRIALQKAETFSLICINVVVFISKIASPFVKLLTFFTNITLKLFGMNAENLEERVSKEVIQSMIEQGKEQGVFNNIEHDMINSIFEFDNKLAREIMTPRIKVFAIDISEPKEEYFDELFEMKYSRIPVYEEEVDNIVGVLYIKDILSEAKKVGFDNIDLKKILHEPYLVPENKNIDELFREMQHQKKYFAILINEYGEFSGVVTIEDLVEEVMGDIADEYDENGPQISEIDNKTYLIDGLVSVDEMNDKFHLEIDSEYYDTISGFMIDELGFIPKDGDIRKIRYRDYVFELVSVKDKRIEKIKMYLPEIKVESLSTEEN
ncbi:MAG: HlyC/CorC family transporter [Candidatus Galacturonibacter soehngenii]|nr:HlyC/CorC family transporter [Candidatus Galacturonibacter soehngenii]